MPSGRTDGSRHTAPAFEDHGGGPAGEARSPSWSGGCISTMGIGGIVEQMYDRLRRYVDFLESKTHDGILRSYTPTTREEDMDVHR